MSPHSFQGVERRATASSNELSGKNMPLFVYAAASYVDSYEGEPQSLVDLKPVLKTILENVPRRLTRFVQLALIGAGRCCQGQELAKDAGVYFSSCRGDTGVTTDLLNELVREKSPPAPLNFVNSVSNAACFYVAKTLGLFGRSNFVANRFDPIVSALSLAQLDLYSSAMSMALIGSVDSCSLPLSHHRARLFVDADQTVAEASHWLLVGKSDGDGAKNKLGCIRSIHYFSDIAELNPWLESTVFANDCLLGVGQHLCGEVVQNIRQISGIYGEFRYAATGFYYDSPTAQGVIDFLVKRNESMMLHLNSDPSGRYTAVVIER